MEPTAIGRDPGERVTLGSTAVAVTRLGLGTGPLGWPVEAATEQTAAAVVDASWSAGVRYFDTAPLYGLGQVEQWLGNALRERPRGDFSLLTKVGRLLRATPSDAGGRATRPSGDSETGCIRDYSADGTLRSLEESLRRLGLERVDIVLIHDPEEHITEALDGAYVALDRLRAQGVVGAIGAGMNHTEPLTRLVRNADLDCVLLAGRYSLLDQSALSDLLPAAAARGTSLIVGGVYNSGILADPQPGALFHYRPAPADVLARVQRMREICRHHGVPLAAAAIQFPFGHPAVRSVVVGALSTGQARQNADNLALPIPAALWDDLRADGAIDPSAPVPAGTAARDP